MREYEVLVLGGGTAGTAAAKAAADAGARTAMFNDGELGGLCILRGCMPTKTMLHAAHLSHTAEHHRTPGVGHAQPDLDFAAVMANKDQKVARFQRAKLAAIEQGGYDVIDARACFTGPDTVAAGDERYRFTRGAVIATGSVPKVPDLPGVGEVGYWTSDDVMRITRQPASALVVGVGAIGLELGQFLARMGTRVTLVSRRPLLYWSHPLIASEMAAAFAAEPRLEVLDGAQPQQVERDGDGIRLRVRTAAGDRAVAAERLILATGRRAALDDLRLEAAGVAVEGDRVPCGDDMRTSNPAVFVAGDATGSTLILHVANQEGRVAGLGAARVPGDHRVDRRLAMEVVFTDPPLATLGMDQEAAARAGIAATSATVRLPETGRSITMDVEHGAAVVVAARENGEILGAQVLGPRADDIIHVLSAIMYYRGTAAQMLEMPWYHPTLSEVLLGLARDLQAGIVPDSSLPAPGA